MRIPLVPVVLLALAAWSSPPAMADIPAALLSVEGQEALTRSLLDLVLLVTVTERPGPYEEPALVRERFGQAVRVSRGGRTVALTSARLVADSGGVAAGPHGGEARPVKLGAVDEASGLAEMETPPGPTATPAPAESCARGSLLFFLAPGAGALRLTRTEMGPDAGPPIDRLAVASGRLPDGAPLFDASGRLAAVALWTPASSSAAIVSPLCLPDTGTAAGAPPARPAGKHGSVPPPPRVEQPSGERRE